MVSCLLAAPLAKGTVPRSCIRSAPSGVVTHTRACGDLGGAPSPAGLTTTVVAVRPAVAATTRPAAARTRVRRRTGMRNSSREWTPVYRPVTLATTPGHRLDAPTSTRQPSTDGLV